MKPLVCFSNDKFNLQVNEMIFDMPCIEKELADIHETMVSEF